MIEAVSPQVDCGRFPIKRTLGEAVMIHADAFADGHDLIRCMLLHRHEQDDTWSEQAMQPLGNDRWAGTFVVEQLGVHQYTVAAWVDTFTSWVRDLLRKARANMDVGVDLLIGADLVSQTQHRASGRDASALSEYERQLRSQRSDVSARVDVARDEQLAALMRRWDERRFMVMYEPALTVTVDRPRARFSAWYELFARSAGDGTSHGTLRDVQNALPYIASMGFDIVYLPPIHPIGRIKRKGRNNREHAESDDVGSPWAIGSREGGHKAIHRKLGSMADFHRLVASAHDLGMELAMDIAFQCAPDHPYVTQHPEWFRTRPDGSVQYAENPPKKYEDIVPFDFETDAWRELWMELKSVFEFWIEQGVSVFRVDNPHTKPLAFWQWLIAALKREHPQLILLSEAFTRPKLMYRLAKVGFTQSYTYFAWRNTRQELESYFTELSTPPVIDFFRANAWPNTPDILNAYLQDGARPAFMIRAVLAATLCASYGIYGPAYELCERLPRSPDSEEYLNSEKYEIRHWDVDRLDSLRLLIGRLNRIRRTNTALQHDRTLAFHATDNEKLICYSKTAGDPGVADNAITSCENIIVVVVNLDATFTQSGWVQLPLHQWGIKPGEPYEMHDVLADVRYVWQGEWNYVQLDPHSLPAHVFRLQRPAAAEGTN